MPVEEWRSSGGAAGGRRVAAMATIYIEDQPYEVARRAEPVGRLPGPGLRPALLLLASGDGFGRAACRQCAVKQFKDDNDRVGKIVMACITPVTEGPASPSTIPTPAPSGRASSSG